MDLLLYNLVTALVNFSICLFHSIGVFIVDCCILLVCLFCLLGRLGGNRYLSYRFSSSYESLWKQSVNFNRTEKGEDI